MKPILILTLSFLFSSTFLMAQDKMIKLELTVSDEKENIINKQKIIEITESLNDENLEDLVKWPTEIKKKFISDYKSATNKKEYSFEETYDNKIYSATIETMPHYKVSDGNFVFLENDDIENLEIDDVHVIVKNVGPQPYLGISYSPFDFKSSRKKMSKVRGIQVDGLDKGETGYNAELEVGDVITKINGVPTPTPSLFRDEIRKLEPQSNVEFTINRNGRTKKMSAIVGSRNLTNEVFPREGELSNIPFFKRFTMENKAKLGVLLVQKDDDVLIEKVMPNSPAEKANLKEGDIVKKVDGLVIQSPDDVVAQIKDKENNDVIRIEIIRNGRPITIQATLEKENTPTKKIEIQQIIEEGNIPDFEILLQEMGREIEQSLEEESPELNAIISQITPQIQEVLEENGPQIKKSIAEGSTAVELMFQEFTPIFKQLILDMEPIMENFEKELEEKEKTLKDVEKTRYM